jgi:hypothetical protein
MKRAHAGADASGSYVLNRNNKYWDRPNHGDHGASRGKAITIVIPVFPVPPVVELMYQCRLV